MSVLMTLSRLTRRSVLKTGGALGGALLLPGAAFAQEEPQRGGTLRVTIPYNPATLDPITGRNAPDFNTLYLIFDALIDFEPDTLALKPGLASAWSFADPTTLVLDLQEGVTFHDGTPFDAEAVKFNLERTKSDPRSNVKSDLAAVDAIEVTGPLQVTLTLSAPNAGLPAVLTNRSGCMVSPAAVQAATDGNVDRTRGSAHR